MRIDEVTYEMAEPAKKMQILLWLISFGKYGKIFVRKEKKYNQYSPGKMVNCRCSIMPATKNKPDLDVKAPPLYWP